MRQRFTLSKATRLEAQGRYEEAIRLLSAAAETSENPALLEPLTRLRQKAFAHTPRDPGREEWPPSYDDCFAHTGSPPEIDVRDLDVDALGGGILHHGCLLVRGLLDPDRVAEMSDAIEKAFLAADGLPGAAERWYVPVQGDEDHPLGRHRSWDRLAGAVWAADSPPALFRLIRALKATGLDRVLTDYFGERPAVSLEKLTLRVTTPEAQNAWHQDGAFMGSSLRTVNAWIALTPCGGDADCPGLDILPKRIDDLVETGTRGALLPDFVGKEIISELAEDCPVIRPRFEPGDALLFDDRFLHGTGVTPGMTKNRLAIECWFFAPSTVPDQYIPLAF